MPTRLNIKAYRQLIDEDIAWLLLQPRTLEREHILDCLRALRSPQWMRNNRPREKERVGNAART